MSDRETIRVFGSDLDEFFTSWTAALQACPPEVAARLRAIRQEYFAKYGFEGTYERVNGRNIAEIVGEYQPTGVRPIASGEIGGLRFRLYEGDVPRGG